MKNISKVHLQFFFILIFVLVAGTLSSCKSGSVPLTPTKDTTTKIETKETLKDTTFHTEADSSSYKVNLGVLGDKNIVMEEVLESKPGKYLSEPKVTIKGNVLTVDCEAYAQALFKQWKEKNTTEVTASIERIPYPVEKDLSLWQIIQIWCGRVFLIGVGFLIGVRLLNIPFLTKNQNDE